MAEAVDLEDALEPIASLPRAARNSSSGGAVGAAGEVAQRHVDIVCEIAGKVLRADRGEVGGRMIRMVQPGRRVEHQSPERSPATTAISAAIQPPIEWPTRCGRSRPSAADQPEIVDDHVPACLSGAAPDRCRRTPDGRAGRRESGPRGRAPVHCPSMVAAPRSASTGRSAANRLHHRADAVYGQR